MITIKGSPKGILISIDDVDYTKGREELEEKLTEAQEFFKDATLSVFLTSNTLTEAELFFLRDTVTRTLTDTQVTFTKSEPKMLPQKHSEFDALAADEGVTKFIRQTVKSGETVEYQHGLVVLGDVEAGGKVVAGGNIFVMGTLAGFAHAGVGGKRDAIVAAMHFVPEALLIGEVSIQGNHNPMRHLFSKKPAFAYIKENRIQVEFYT